MVKKILINCIVMVFTLIMSTSFAVASVYTDIDDTKAMLNNTIKAFGDMGEKLHQVKQNTDNIIERKKQSYEIIHKVEEQVEQTLSQIIKLQDRCGVHGIINRTHYDFCYGYAQEFAEKTALMFIGIAEMYKMLGSDYLSESKRVYRNIIVTYTGTSYASYVEQAKFGLKDIEEMEAKAEREKLEKEKAELQKQLEQEKIAREKAEQAKKKKSVKKK